MQFQESRILLPFQATQHSPEVLKHLCDRVADGFVVPFTAISENVVAENIARIRQVSMQLGVPTAVIADIEWSPAMPTGIALALAKGVDWVLASNIHRLDDLRQFQNLLRSGPREVPLIVRLPAETSPVLAEELLLSCQGIWGEVSAVPTSLLTLAHQLGKLTVIEASEANQDLPACHCIYLRESPESRPRLDSPPGDALVSQDVLWAADALRSRRPNAKLALICENIEEAGLAASLSFHHPAILICRHSHILRAANLFRGYPAILDPCSTSLEELFMASEERLAALRLVRPGETLIYVTGNLSAIHCRIM